MDEKYKKYLKSKEWKDKRESLFKQRGKSCETCGSIELLHIHHKTYKNIYNEPLSDLQILCKICHYKIHNKPVIEKEIKTKKNKVRKTQTKKPKKSKQKFIKWINKPYLVEVRKLGSSIISTFGFTTEQEAIDFYTNESKHKKSKIIKNDYYKDIRK